ncbi:hypothetical protein [Rhodoferax sp.]|uniref:hypothetical protein n=1 Tax=Rhodoferax sp. TaxID=50421 RepID=UPI00274C0F56|nr:hypothetical protein [Rhodoferax sp.]
MMHHRDGTKLAWAACLLAGVAVAAEPPAGSLNADSAGGIEVGANRLRLTVDSKLRLIKSQLTQSPAVQRILQSDHAQAKQKLADAQAVHERAEVELKEGRQEAAIKLLDAALRDIVAASNLVPDMANLAARERRQNAELREAIRTFQSLHKGLSSRMATIKRHAPGIGTEVARIDEMMERADTLIATGDQHQANVLLNAAYAIVVPTLNRMLSAETIVYELKFESVAQEYAHELARNRSFEELIPIALTRLGTSSEAAALADRYVSQSRDLRELARQQTDKADYRAALKTIQSATAHLERALRIAGLVVPQSTEIAP